MQTENNAYFYGHYTNSISSKGQVAIPKRFRDNLNEAETVGGFVLLPGQDRCLYLYTHLEFASIKTRVREMSVQNNAPEFFRSFMEEVLAIDTDNQGRFVIPQRMREYADLSGKEITFIGMDDRIEIWNPELRATERDKENKQYQQLRNSNATAIFGI